MSISYSYRVSAAKTTAQIWDGGRADIERHITVTVSGNNGESKFDIPVVVSLSESVASGFSKEDRMTADQMLSLVKDSPLLEDARIQIEQALAKGNYSDSAP